MTKGRLEAFSDGVLAVIITIMVLELAAPHEPDLAAIRHLTPVLLSYVLSYIFIGIYWSNHHHLFQAVHHVDGRILWANLHLLFWLSLVPFTTAWMGDTHFASLPVAAYGCVLLMAAVGYFLLVQALLARPGNRATLEAALGSDFKGKISIVCYMVAVALALRWPFAACGLYVVVAIMWLVPDRRIERTLHLDEEE